MRVGLSGDVVGDGRIEGHMEGVQLEVMLFSNVFSVMRRYRTRVSE